MADKAPNLRNLEPEGSLYINKWWTGLYKNASPLFTPVSALGIQLIQRQDKLWDGLNMMVTPQYTLRRRYGFLRYCPTAFGAPEYPLAFYSFQNLAGGVMPIADTQGNVRYFSPSGMGSLWAKLVGAGQSNFNDVGNTLYWCDGVSAMKYVGPNLLTYSDTFTNAAWTAQNITLTAGQTDPNGGNTATKVVVLSTSNPVLYEDFTPPYLPVRNNTFTFSVWVQLVGGTGTFSLTLQPTGGGTQFATQTFTPTSTWTRYSITGTAGSFTGLRALIWQFSSTSMVVNIYGAQLEVGGAVTTYNGTTNLPQGTYQMGIVAPATAPTLTFAGYGTAWSASTVEAVNNTITDSNGNLQTVSAITGDYKTGTKAPTWATTQGTTTTDNHVTWTCGGPNGLNPTVGYTWGYCYRSSLIGNSSTMSPASANSGRLIGQAVTVTGARSTDPSVDLVDIYRIDDGGAVYYRDATVANPSSGTWSYVDTNQDSSLNNLIIAALAGVNNPPPAGASLFCWYAGRLWCASGNTLYYSTGPDTTNGVGMECWAIGNNYTLPGNITALAGTSSGLIIWTTDDAYVTTGTNSANFTVPQIWQANWGVASQNCVAQDGDNLYILTSRGQVFNFSANGISELGFLIEAQLAAFNPAASYIALHRSGADEGCFISDGSANIYRYSQVANAWDTVIQPVGGCGCIGSIEVSPANWRLMLGRPSGSGYILDRDLNTFTDDGTAYSAWAIVGSLTVAPPRHVVNVESLLLQITGITGSTYPTLSVLCNEVSDTAIFPATFVVLPNPVPDPPQLPATQTVWTRRHDFKAAQSPLPSHVQHMQIKIVFVGEAYPNEILGLGVKVVS